MSGKGETRASDVLQRMRDDILNCQLQPGLKLRFELLRERYGVSFSTLREALARLSAERLVLSEGQRGFLVAPLSVAELEDLTASRVLVEREGLRRSMERGDDSWEAGILASFHRMDRLQSRLGAACETDAEWAALHGKFHLALVSACASPTLLEMRETLFLRAYRYRRLASDLRPGWQPAETGHRAIMEQALDRSPEALDLLERHFSEATAHLLDHAGDLFATDAAAHA